MTKPLSADVKISPTGRPYIETETLVKRALKRAGADNNAAAELSRLKEEVVEAACEFIDDDCPENREALYIARAALRDFVYEREQGEKKS